MKTCLLPERVRFAYRKVRPNQKVWWYWAPPPQPLPPKRHRSDCGLTQPCPAFFCLDCQRGSKERELELPDFSSSTCHQNDTSYITFTLTSSVTALRAEWQNEVFLKLYPGWTFSAASTALQTSFLPPSGQCAKTAPPGACTALLQPESALHTFPPTRWVQERETLRERDMEGGRGVFGQIGRVTAH